MIRNLKHWRSGRIRLISVFRKFIDGEDYSSIRTLRRIWAVPNKVIFCSSWIFNSAGTFVMWLCSSLEITPSAPITIGIVTVDRFHILFISISRFLYLDIFSNSLTEMFLSAGTAISISMHFLFTLSYL